MPRGRSKQAYGNRTDLNGKIAKSAPTGMPYGENQKLMDRQSAVPMGTPEMAAPEATPETPNPMAPEATPITPVTEAPMSPLGTTSLMAPTDFPDESIGQGLLPQTPIDPDISRLKTTYLPMFMEEAGKPNAPVMFRDFVKWLNNL